MPVIPRHMSKSAKLHVFGFDQAALAANGDRAQLPFFVSPLEIYLEEIVVVPLGDKTMDDAEDTSVWEIAKRDQVGGAPAVIQTVTFNGLETITGEAVGKGNGSKTEFELDHYPISNLVVKIEGTPTTAYSIDPDNPKLIVFDEAVDNDDDVTADYVGSDEADPLVFPASGVPFRMLSPDKGTRIQEADRYVPYGGTLYLEITNSATAATPAVFIELIYTIAQEL
jgi:hypothetical protein